MAYIGKVMRSAMFSSRLLAKARMGVHRHRPAAKMASPLAVPAHREPLITLQIRRGDADTVDVKRTGDPRQIMMHRMVVEIEEQRPPGARPR